MKQLKEPPLNITVYCDDNEKIIKRRFTIDRKFWSSLRIEMEEIQDRTFGRDNSIRFPIYNEWINEKNKSLEVK